MSLSTVRKILVPVDFSAHSKEALAWADDLAKRIGASLMILHVSEPVVYVTDDGNTLMNEAAQSAALVEREAELDSVRRELTAGGAAQIETELLVGLPSAEIVRVAREGDFDLVIMGTHGRTGVKRVLLGSVAAKVVRHAPCPVLTVRLPGQRPARAARSTPSGRSPDRHAM